MINVIVNAARSRGTIDRNLYGHFAEHLGRCVYGGLYVGEDSDIPNVNGMRSDAVSALRELHVPVLRWPGGCFADTYHWRDGVGPKGARPSIVNTNWGGVTENNAFGTHEFLELCRQLGCEAYISGNVGSGTVQELSDWIEYCNMGGVSPMAAARRANGREEPWHVRYWGIGNEAWGCGGNMRAEYYADLCRRYATYMRDYDPAHPIVRIASGANVDDYGWTKTVAERAGQMLNAVSLHYYTIPTGEWTRKGSALAFGSAEHYAALAQALYMDELIENHSRILRAACKGRKIGLVVDEWGAWYDVEEGTNPAFLYQQNAMRDALIAAVHLNIFNNHCDSVVMANIAQTVNVLQAMVLTEGDRMILTPTYHVFRLYRAHQGARQLECYARTRLVGPEGGEVPQLHASASQDAQGNILVTVANLSESEPCPVDCLVADAAFSSASAQALFGDTHAHNDFGDPQRVAPAPLPVAASKDGFHAVLPPCCVAAFTLKA